MRRIDRYEVREELGRGGVGVVYRAYDPEAHREVAVKVLLAAAQLDPELVERFRIEARAGAAVDHPGIVRVLDAGIVEGKPFLVTELATGGSLADRVRRGPLPGVEAARLVEQVARALHHAHERGVLHRDLKPANVLLDGLAQPLLTDFGMARFGDARLTQSGDVLGTPAYMAPEQAAGARHHVGPWSDVYALGATLYELLTGRPPFTGSSALAILEAAVATEPTAPRALRTEVDPGLETICLRAMAKVPARRYVSALELADALAAWRTGAKRPAVRGGGARGALPRALGLLGGAALVATLVVLTRDGSDHAPSSDPGHPATITSNEPVARAPTREDLRASAAARRAAGDLIGAVGVLTEALTLPGDGEVELLLDRAELLIRLQRHSEAIEDTDRAITLAPDRALAYALRASALGVEDAAGAARDAERAIALDPALAEGWRARGMLRFFMGDAAAGRADLDRAVELPPRNGDVRAERAEVLEALGELGLARGDLEAALALPRERYGEARLLGNLAGVCWRAGDRAAARERCAAALAADAEEPTALAVRALDLLEAGDAEGALRVATRLGARRRSAKSAFVVGAVLHARGDPAGLAELWNATWAPGWPETKRRAHAVASPAFERMLSLVLDGEEGEAMALVEPILRERPRFSQGLVLRGKARLEGGDAAGALRDIEEAIAAEGTGPVRRTLRAEARLQAGDAAGALEDATQALRGAPPVALAARLSSSERGLIALAWRVSALARAELGDPRAALEELERADALDGRPTWAGHRARARVLRRVNDDAGARRELEAAERVATPRQRARSRLPGVESLVTRGALEEAAAECDDVIAAVPSLAAGWRARAGVKLARGDAAGAVEDATRALELASYDRAARAVRGEGLFRLGRHADAHADLRRLVSDTPTPDHVKALERLETVLAQEARRLLESGRRDDAIAECRRLVADVPENGHAWFLLGRLSADAGDVATARGAFDRALDLRPADLAATAELAATLAERGAPQLATAVLGREARRAGPDLHLLVAVGRKLVQAGHPSLARGVLEMAVQVDARTPELLVSRADAHQLLGDDRAAAADVQRALRRSPGHPPARLARAHLRRWADGDSAVADAECEEVLAGAASDHRPMLEGVVTRDRAAATCPFEHPHPRR